MASWIEARGAGGIANQVARPLKQNGKFHDLQRWPGDRYFTTCSLDAADGKDCVHLDSWS